MLSVRIHNPYNQEKFDILRGYKHKKQFILCSYFLSAHLSCAVECMCADVRMCRGYDNASCNNFSYHKLQRLVLLACCDFKQNHQPT